MTTDKQIIRLKVEAFTARKEILSYLAMEGIKCWQETVQQKIYTQINFFVCFEIDVEVKEEEPKLDAHLTLKCFLDGQALCIIPADFIDLQESKSFLIDLNLDQVSAFGKLLTGD